MKYILIILFIINIGYTRAQSISNETISSFGISNKRMLSIGGESILWSEVESEQLKHGFVETVLAERGEGTSTNIEEIETNLLVYVQDNNIIVRVDKDWQLSIYSIQGKMIVNKNISNEESFSLIEGIYIVVLKNSNQKNVFKVVI